MKEGRAGSYYLIIIGLLLAFSGAVFTWLLGVSFSRAREMDNWVETKCLILESDLRERKIGLEVPTEYRCLLYTSPSPRDLSTSRMPSSA